MTYGNKDEKSKNEEPQQQLSEKIEPNLPKILREFSELLEIKYGLSGFTVVSFKLQPDLPPIDLPEGPQAAVAFCSYECAGGTCSEVCVS